MCTRRNAKQSSQVGIHARRVPRKSYLIRCKKHECKRNSWTNGGLSLKSQHESYDISLQEMGYSHFSLGQVMICQHSLGLPINFSIVCMPFVPCQGGEAEVALFKTWFFRGSDSSQDCSTQFRQYVPYNTGSLACAVRNVHASSASPQRVFNGTILFYRMQNHCSFWAATFVC